MARRPPRGVLCLILVLAVLGVPADEAARASGLEVTAAAAHTGSPGLRVEIGTTCAGPQDVLVSGQVLSGTSTTEGCASVSSDDTTVASGDVTFRAGERIVLGDGFSVASGARFVAQVDSTLQPDAFLEDETPRAESHYAAAFYLNADLLNLSDGDRFDLLRGLANNGTKWFAVVLKRDSSLGENRIVLEMRLQNGALVSTEGSNEIVLPSGWSWLGIDWKREPTNFVYFGGYLSLYLENGFKASVGGNNTGARIDTIRLGAQGVPTGASGTFDVDRFISRIAGPIAPP